MDNNQLTPEEANALVGEAVGASIERDVAINAAAQASVNEAAAKEAARSQGVAARSAEAQAAEMNTLRHVANARADQEAQSAETSRFGFYLLTGIVLAALVVVVMWLATRTPETNVTSPSGASVPAQTGQVPLAPSAAPPSVIPGPQGAQGPQGPAGSSAPQGAQGPAGKPGPSGPSGASGPAGPTVESGASAPDSTPPPSGQ